MRAWLLILLSLATVTVAHAEKSLFLREGAIARPLDGWVSFCKEHPQECVAKPSARPGVTLSRELWRELEQVNAWVNSSILYMTDMEQWGVKERWSYPDSGYGDCEDYVLLKRRLLEKAGWPRDSLLITVVAANDNEGHAVLTVKTNEGDFILDNSTPHVLLWSRTGYQFLGSQSQRDPNVWVSLTSDIGPLSSR